MTIENAVPDAVKEQLNWLGLDDIHSGSELTLKLAMSGISLDRPLAMGLFLTATYDYELFEMLIDMISNTGTFDEFCDIELVEFIFSVYKHTINVSQYFNTLEHAYSVEIGRLRQVSEFYSYDKGTIIRDKYKLLTAIDRRFPFLLVKFFTKNRLSLSVTDPQFVTWLNGQLKKKASLHPTFKQVSDALSKAIGLCASTTMHLT